MLVILDYGMGNLRSVEKAVEFLGYECQVQPHLKGATKLIIPGVGAFGAAMERVAPLANDIRAFANGGAPLMGICLGQQLLFERSEEYGEQIGLGLIAGEVKYFPKEAGLKVPQIGWNEAVFAPNSRLGKGNSPDAQVYFVHSLYTECAESSDIAAKTDYGVTFASAIERGNIWGTKFPGKKRRRRPAHVKKLSGMLILPAIDIRDGKCVRLTQGDYAQETIYDSDPAAVAASFEEQGAQFLHIVDLDGARAGGPKNLAALKQIVKAIKIPIEFGGGIRSLDSARAVLELGVARVIIGTKLVQDRILAARMFDQLGAQIVAGIDAKSGKVAVSGWIEESTKDAFEFAKSLESDGATRFIVTDIATDGALMGPNLDFLVRMSEAVSGPVIASGGISSIDDLCKISSLNRPNLEGVIVGKAIYEKRFTIKEVLNALSS